MTDRIMEQMWNPDHGRVLRFVHHILDADAAMRGVDAVDVERLFAAVELLIDRAEHPWSPFVSAWSPGLESFADPRSREWDIRRDLDQFERELQALTPSEHSRSPLGRSARDATDALGRAMVSILSREQGQDVNRVLADVREEMLRSLVAVLRIEDAARVGYLEPLADVARDQGVLTIATLNYDRGIEEMAESAGVSCDTGIDTWLTRGELDWPTHGLRLLKLHGSIDWVSYEVRGPRTLPMTEIRRATFEVGGGDPAVVFGEAGKLRAEGPYIALLLAWAAQLDEADTLLVAGYSFRDQHVNETVARWFNADPRRRIILIDPVEPSQRDWDSFAGRLPFLNERFPNDPPDRRPRFRYLAGTTKERLPDAIRIARDPNKAPSAQA